MGMLTNFTPLFLIFLMFLHIRSFQTKVTVGYNTRYIHRDSKLSPLYNPSLTKSQRSKNAIARSHARYSHIKAVHSLAASASNNVNTTTETDPNGGDYLMLVSLGSQKVPLWMIADTGSVLGWTTCNINRAGFYNPKSSTSYSNVACSSTSQCINSGGYKCKKSLCNFDITYGDNSETGGVLGVDTLYFPTTSNGTASLPSFVFGCSSYYYGFDVSSPTGLIGLGYDPVSLPNQLGVSTFSYCLPGSDVNTSYGSINFGSTGVVTGSNVYKAKLFTSSSDIFYFMNLTGITVNGVIYNTNYAASPGNTIIDSGTTLTYLPSTTLAAAVNSALEKSINCTRAVSYENTNGLAPCYQASSCFVVPPIVAHFQGTDIPLTQSNAFLEVDTNVYCSAFTNDGGNDVGIWGNIAQSDFKVGYDITNQVINFKRTQCAASS
ncbi:hypothetical protein M569_10980 [Genlisea aurea]|uniref:Peptidase A1 domain-containing protein n=1 Tax=Genlisea aurea TaxID=192259 RepID=S8DLI6_9LAMI|nr:hypothetical protein M569_10980 [Genlisea aurea]